MTTDERIKLRTALVDAGWTRVGYTQDNGTGMYEEYWEPYLEGVYKNGDSVTISWGPKTR